MQAGVNVVPHMLREVEGDQWSISECDGVVAGSGEADSAAEDTAPLGSNLVVSRGRLAANPEGTHVLDKSHG
jgi:hypothetical protein